MLVACDGPASVTEAQLAVAGSPPSARAIGRALARPSPVASSTACCCRRQRVEAARAALIRVAWRGSKRLLAQQQRTSGEGTLGVHAAALLGAGLAHAHAAGQHEHRAGVPVRSLLLSQSREPSRA